MNHYPIPLFCVAQQGQPELSGLLASLLSQAAVVNAPVPEQGLYLLADSSGLSLAKAGHKGRVRVDFTDGVARHRRLFGGGELLSRAVQAKSQPKVWDATGGLGRDAFVLASMGLDVVVFEQHPVVYALLADGLQRARDDEQTAAVVGHMQLRPGSITSLVPLSAENRPDVVYLDPMYPHRQKSAAVKKEMAYFHDLVGLGDEQQEQQLLDVARQWATKRIVVKRPHNGVFLASAKPAFQYSGKTTRFDVYLPLTSAIPADGGC